MGKVLELVALVLPPEPEHREAQAASDLSDLVDRLSETPQEIAKAADDLAAGAPELSDLAQAVKTLAQDPRLDQFQRLAEHRSGGMGILEEAHRFFRYLDKGDHIGDSELLKIALDEYAPKEPTPEQADALEKLYALVEAARQTYLARQAIEGHPSL